MNIGEADATQHVLRYFLGLTGNSIDTQKQALENAMYLADRSQTRLLAGLSGVQLASHWATPARVGPWATAPRPTTRSTTPPPGRPLPTGPSQPPSGGRSWARSWPT